MQKYPNYTYKLNVGMVTTDGKYHITKNVLYIWLLRAHTITPKVALLSRMTLGLRPVNERRRYKVTPSLIGWAKT